MRPSRRVTAVLAAALLIGGCSTGGGDEPSGEEAATADEGATATEPSASPSPSDPAGTGELLDVSGRSLDGGQFAFADAAGERLVLWMWAPW